MYIRGNLYEYYTGLKNYKNYGIDEALFAVLQFTIEFQINRKDVEILKLELGINIVTAISFSAKDFISFQLSYKGRRPNFKNFPGGGSMATYWFYQFNIKLYDKGVQFKKGHNLLRYEFEIKNKSYLHRYGIFSLEDLFNYKKLERLNKVFINTIDHLIIYDTRIQPEQLSAAQKKLFLKFGNSTGWNTLMSENPSLYRKKKLAFRNTMTKVTGWNWNGWFKDSVYNESLKLLALHPKWSSSHTHKQSFFTNRGFG
jgi:hypothetical protein